LGGQLQYGRTSIAVNFSGRGVNNDFGTGAFLTTTETAGVTPQAHWNNVDINGGNPASARPWA